MDERTVGIDSKALAEAVKLLGCKHEYLIRHAIGRYLAALSKPAALPAEGKGESEAWSVNIMESDGRTYLSLKRADGVAAALSCRTNTDNGETIASQVAKQFAADYATPSSQAQEDGR